MYHNLFDSHVHSDNSADAAHSVIYLAEQAQQEGLMGIAITDHADCLGFVQDNYHTRIVQSIVDTNKAAAAFRYRMSFSVGVEIGLYGGFETADYIVGMYPFDFILAAVHQNRSGKDFYELDFRSMSPEEHRQLLDDYFEDLLGVVEWGRFNSLAHLTFPVRCAMRKYGILLNLEPHREQIDVILKTLVQKGKALELNTAGLRSALRDFTPSAWAVRRYKELGGELITIGSDAHRIEDLGAGIQDGMALLEEVGYRFFAFYRASGPVMLRIV